MGAARGLYGENTGGPRYIPARCALIQKGVRSFEERPVGQTVAAAASAGVCVAGLGILADFPLPAHVRHFDRIRGF